MRCVCPSVRPMVIFMVMAGPEPKRSSFTRSFVRSFVLSFCASGKGRTQFYESTGSQSEMISLILYEMIGLSSDLETLLPWRRYSAWPLNSSDSVWVQLLISSVPFLQQKNMDDSWSWSWWLRFAIYRNPKISSQS